MYCTVYSPERITKFSGQTSFLSSLTDYETPQVLTVSHSEVDLWGEGEPLLQGPELLNKEKRIPSGCDVLKISVENP